MYGGGPVKVGPFYYDVRYDEARVNAQAAATRSDADTVAGYSDHMAFIIYLRDTESAQSQRDTLLHEVLHCVQHVTGWRYRDEEKPEEDERFIMTLCPMLLCVLRENPELVRFLTEKGAAE